MPTHSEHFAMMPPPPPKQSEGELVLSTLQKETVQENTVYFSQDVATQSKCPLTDQN